MFFVMLKLIPADADVERADIEQRTLGLHSTSQMCSSVNGNRFLCPRFVFILHCQDVEQLLDSMTISSRFTVVDWTSAAMILCYQSSRL